jgi:hypothetical protein
VTLEAAEQQFALYMEKVKKRIANIEIV